MVTDDVILQQLQDAIEQAWQKGSPVANPDAPGGREKAARVALRRWRSLARRHGTKPLSREGRVEDLAKGLRDAFERDRDLVGPLMEDYRHLAGVLLDILEAQRHA